MIRKPLVRAALLAACIVLINRLPTAISAAPSSSFLTPDLVKPNGSGNYTVSYTMNITLAYGAPSCFARPVVLVSGIFEANIAINQYDWLNITVINNIPASYPDLMDGISLHWHGFQMMGAAAWYDGPGYVAQCPIQPGNSYTIMFQVNETPGTYWWHDHVGGFKGDGLYGALIVYPPRAPLPSPDATPAWPPAALPDLWSYDGEHVIILSDWFHSAASTLFMRVNQPMLPPFVTNDTGSFQWIGNPQSLLINGRGFYGDCQLPGNNLGASARLVKCNPTTFTVAPGRSPQQPWASSNNPGCTHEELTVEAGKTYRLRLINSAMLTYLTTCFDGHNVTVIAADGVPTAPLTATCVDVHAGQRLDVLLTANQSPSTYWITTVSNVPDRSGTPAGYAVLRYNSSSVPSGSFPPTPAPQPADITVPFTNDQLVMSPALLGNNSYATRLARRRTSLKASPFGASLAPPKTANKLLVFNTTGVVILQSGEAKYALGNVAHPETPPCQSLLNTLRKDPSYLNRMTVMNPRGTGAGPNWGLAEVNSSDPFPVYQDGLSPIPSNPAIGLHVVPLKLGQVVDMVINYMKTSPDNEIHPIHLHGHRFWVLGRGNGTYVPATDYPGLNLVNPTYRDTATVRHGAWLYLRFIADNPGVWPMHCHILPHGWLGQMLYFMIDVDKSSPPPKVMPPCPKKCMYQNAPYTKSWMSDKWGATGYEVPPLS